MATSVLLGSVNVMGGLIYGYNTGVVNGMTLLINNTVAIDSDWGSILFYYYWKLRYLDFSL